MDRFNVMTDTLHGGLAGIADWIRGCSHSKTTFPMTLSPSVDAGGQRAPAETYVACLACGRHLAYDWSAMRITRERFPQAARGVFRQGAEANRAWHS
jgi:hypothetical protein